MSAPGTALEIGADTSQNAGSGSVHTAKVCNVVTDRLPYTEETIYQQLFDINNKIEIELDDDDFMEEEDDSSEAELLNSSTANLTRRRQIDDYLEERRLQKELADYDYD